jgi:predicted Zn-dependent protease
MTGVVRPVRGPAVRLLPGILLALGLCVLSLGCDTGEGQGPGHRAQRLALTPDQELALGEQAYQQVLHRSHPLPRSDREVQEVRRVGERIAKAAEIEPLQREIHLRLKGYRFDWAFNVLQDKQINAFCLPGGKVAVFTGLLPVVQNDDQLATVMSHEIAHALAHHASERIARQQMYETAVQAIGGAMGSMDPDRRRALIGALSAGAEVRSLAYDRQQESEADHIGVFLMTFAGYDPDQAVAFWERMQRAMAQGSRPPEILSDHPSDARRIVQLKAWAPLAKAGKRAYDQGQIAPGPQR